MKSGQLSAISFQPTSAEAEWTGDFQLDNRRPALLLEPDGWLVASAPVPGAPVDLLCRQAAIHGPAKVTAGPSLRVELPCEKKAEERFAAMRSALAHGLQVLARNNRVTAVEASEQIAAEQTLADYCSSGPREWSQEGQQFLLRVETDFFLQKIMAVAEQGCVHFCSDLVRVRDPAPVSLRALVLFLLALNSRLRLARGSLLADRVVLEVRLPAWNANAWLLDKAVGALMVGARVAKRECAALLEPAAARTYCEFHDERR
jgi:hypothetical protein